MALVIPPGAVLEGALIVLGADDHVPCYFEMLRHLQLAIAHRKRWIRVTKPGHTCEALVPALVEHCHNDWRTIPRCLIATPRELEDIGASVERSTPGWSGAAFAPLVTAEAV